MSQSSTAPGMNSTPPYDLVVLGTGLAAAIASFFPWWGTNYSGPLPAFDNLATPVSDTAWHSYSTLGLLLIFIGTIYTAAVIFARDQLPEMSFDARWPAAGVCALGAFLYLIRLFTLPHRHINFGDGVSASEGIRWGGYLLLIIVLVNAAAAVMGALSSDEPTPWAHSGAGGGMQSWSTAAPGSTAPPPPAATMPPPVPPSMPPPVTPPTEPPL